jgi:hypothetical protein
MAIRRAEPRMPSRSSRFVFSFIVPPGVGVVEFLVKDLRAFNDKNILT